jgi:hypothetical protein
MRCIACDKKLTDYESTRRHGMTHEFLDMCNRCLKDVPNIPTKDRADLVKETDYDDEDTVDDDSVTNCYTLDVDKDE